MGYLVKELFGPTVQGEGAHAGMPCVFLRFASCNLRCAWCDTDYDARGARRMTAADIAGELVGKDVHEARRVVVTGGEPTLQWDEELRAVLGNAGFTVHMETNGTRVPAAPVDWVTVSPKLQWQGELALQRADECKLVVDDSVTPQLLGDLEKRDYGALYLQPCMDAGYERHLARTINLVTEHPRWRLSLQMHKIIGLP